MSAPRWYLLLAVLGAVLPYWQFFPWLMQHGLHLRLMLDELFSTRVGAFFGMDVLLSAVALFAFMGQENLRQPVPRWWIAVLATCLVGVSCGMPLFLYLRERALPAAC